MAKSVLEMAKELVSAQIKVGGISPEKMTELLTTTHHHLLSLQSREESGTQAGADQTVSQLTDWKKSITKHTVICLECGASFKQLSTRHLRHHHLDSRSYRHKYGIPRTQALSAKETTDRRRAITQQSRPWEKAPTYLKAQGKTIKSKENTVKTAKAPAKRKTSAKKAKAN